MAMSSEPSVLVADEATTALDVTTQAQILEMIRDIAKKTNTAVVIVTHNLGIVARFAERIYVMYAGVLLKQRMQKDCLKIRNIHIQELCFGRSQDWMMTGTVY